MKKNNALAYIRQLCCLGLGREILIPELLRTIQGVIPSSSNVFVGLDEHHFPNHVVTEFFVPEAVDFYVNNNRRIHNGGVITRLRNWHATNSVLDIPDLIIDGFYRSEYFNEVWRPCDQYHFLQGKVCRDRKTLAYLMIFRSRNARPFSAADKALFEQLLPYAAHALRTGSAVPDDATPTASGLFILKPEGQLLFADKTARRLLSMARYPHYPVSEGTPVREVTVPPAVARLCHNLTALFRNQEALPPALTEENPRGRFVFRAHWMDPVNPGPDSLIGVTVEHQEPATLRSWRGLKDLPLTPAQREVCLLLEQNQTQGRIAQLLGIRATTAKDHVRKVYDRLAIHRRE